jgi:hypothetical protein
VHVRACARAPSHCLILFHLCMSMCRPDRYFGNMVVEELNTIATGIMAQHDIPVLDLYSQVSKFCGQVYKVHVAAQAWTAFVGSKPHILK